MASIEKRINKDGQTSYRVKVRMKGQPVQSATFTRRTDAKKWAADTESAIREGRHFKTALAKRHTLKELITRYINDVLPTKPKNEAKQKAQLKWWSDEIGIYTLADTTPSLLAEQRDKLLNEIIAGGNTRSPATVVRYMAALSTAFSCAVKEWGWLHDNPMQKVTKPKEPRGRVRFLSDNERNRLLIACKASSSPSLYPAVVLALSTGARQGELLGLCWADVDLNRGRAIFHDTKNGEVRAAPLTGHALEVVKELNKVRCINCDMLFPHTKNQASNTNKPVNFRSQWLTALKQADIQDFKFHDLRHTAASYLAMNGASLAEIAEILGHKTLAMVKRYAHLSQEHTHAVVASMNKQMFGE